MKFQIKNGTRYDDEALRAVLQPVVDLLVAQKGPRRGFRAPSGMGWRWNPLVVVHFVYTLWNPEDVTDRNERPRVGSCAGRGYSGSAYVLGTKCTLRVPRNRLDVQSLAALWLHEAWHLWGVKGHSLFPDAVRHCAIRTVESVVPPGELFESAPAPSPRLSAEELTKRRRERQEAAVARLLERQVTWARKLARAETALRKINRSLAGYRARGVLPEVVTKK